MIRILVLIFFSCSLLAEESEFQQMMGKGTRAWVHLSKVEDVLALQKFEELYEQNKALRFGKEGAPKIPHVLHFLSLSGEKLPLPVMEAWIERHPGWQFKCWTDAPTELPAEVELLDAHQFPFLFLRSDFLKEEDVEKRKQLLRFEILYQKGGVVVDDPTLFPQNFDGLSQSYDLFCGLKAPHAPKSGRNLTTGQGIVGARSFHPITGKMLRELSKGKRGFPFTEAILERFGEDGNVDIVFPASYFYATEKTATPELEPLSPKKRIHSLFFWVNLGAMALLCLFLIRKKFLERRE